MRKSVVVAGAVVLATIALACAETRGAPRAEGDAITELAGNPDLLVLDVRSAAEIEAEGTLEGYLNIPIDELAGRLDEVPRGRPILTA